MDNLIFTEHDEVIMSVAEMRDMLRYAVYEGYRYVDTLRDGYQSPETWVAESYVLHTETLMREHREPIA